MGSFFSIPDQMHSFMKLMMATPACQPLTYLSTSQSLPPPHFLLPAFCAPGHLFRALPPKHGAKVGAEVDIHES